MNTKQTSSFGFERGDRQSAQFEILDEENLFSQNTSSKKGDGEEGSTKRGFGQEVNTIVGTNFNSEQMTSPSQLAFTEQKFKKTS